MLVAALEPQVGILGNLCPVPPECHHRGLVPLLISLSIILQSRTTTTHVTAFKYSESFQWIIEDVSDLGNTVQFGNTILKDWIKFYKKLETELILSTGWKGSSKINVSVQILCGIKKKYRNHNHHYILLRCSYLSILFVKAPNVAFISFL